MNRPLSAKLAAQLGAAVTSGTAASGGDINQAYHVRLADGRQVFVKTHNSAPPGMFRCEAEGLRWLADARALRVPEVLLACDADELGPACLVLEAIQTGRRGGDFAERLGAGLAAMHAAGAPGFGFAHPNYLATLRQDNRACERWGDFYAERRIAPLTQRAAQRGVLPGGLVRKIEQLLSRIPELVGPDEPPARLHGDLWGGNLMCDRHGAPVLIDPAVYGGHREIDLAMMRLFGGFPEAVFDAYRAACPLHPGYAERLPLYQLYPLLAHVNLFGAGYVPQVERCIARWV